LSSQLFHLRSLLKRLKNHPLSPPLSFSDYPIEPAPFFSPLTLRKGDRLAICGDSITEQRLYSVLIESYLTICRPELEIQVRHYGWSGEKSGEFLQRMEADVLRFQPTVATTLYGMNDFLYIPYDEQVAAKFRNNQQRILQRFLQTGCRCLLGSPTIIDAVPDWVKTARGSQYDLNLALCRYRNLAMHLAAEEKVAFADVFTPMLTADFMARQRYGPHFKVAGSDGVHPDWAGQAIISHVFLKQLGMEGDLGTILLDEATGSITLPPGHHLLAPFEDGQLLLCSERLPFCPGPGPENVSKALRAGMALIPFEDELNRFILKITSPSAASYEVTWQHETRHYPAADLQNGISLTKDFPANPLVVPFLKIWDAVVAKQAFETRQYKELLPQAKTPEEREAILARTEETRRIHLQAIQAARIPVEHQLSVRPVPHSTLS